MIGDATYPLWYYAIVLGTLALFGLLTVAAIAWSYRAGHFENFERTAASIFDADEPIGQVTDRFPTRGAGDE
jgi:cbb3-type cytochrome oxidase subunit 3